MRLDRGDMFRKDCSHLVAYVALRRQAKDSDGSDMQAVNIGCGERREVACTPSAVDATAPCIALGSRSP
jgi:hypothetical protein